MIWFILTVKRLEKRGKFDLPFMVFPKMLFIERESEIYLFVAFKYIISHIFSEIVIETAQVVQNIWRFSPSILTTFIDFLDFLTVPCWKETNDVSKKQIMSAFLTSNVLQIDYLKIVLSYIDIRLGLNQSFQIFDIWND